MWKFTCKAGLRQNDCEMYKKDEKSRGAGRYAGCPSCVHRRAASAGTRAAENYYRLKMSTTG